MYIISWQQDGLVSYKTHPGSNTTFSRLTLLHFFKCLAFLFKYSVEKSEWKLHNILMPAKANSAKRHSQLPNDPFGSFQLNRPLGLLCGAELLLN